MDDEGLDVFSILTIGEQTDSLVNEDYLSETSSDEWNYFEEEEEDDECDLNY